MRRFTLLVVLAAAAVIDLPAADTPVAGETGPIVRLIEFDGPITPISALRITQAIDEAERAGDAFVLIELDTPGGLVDSMETIVKRMLAAELPIVVWVGPSGAKAASAGFFLLLSADVAAMAPGTRTGAASGVHGFGSSEDGDVMLRKVNEDLAALIRSIADRRGRDVGAAERAVFDAKSYEEQVALELGLVDLIAPSRDGLLQLLDGMEITRFDGSTSTIRTAGARFEVTEFSLRHEFMELLSVPAVAAFLFFAGLLGIYVEFTHPGVVFPGVVGALCLLLFALSARVLPISTIGVLLILLGVLMFVLEIKVTSFGMLTVGGAVALAIGGWMLVEGPIPELRVPPTFLVPLVVAVTAVCAFVLRLAVAAQRLRVTSGREGLSGEIGTVSVDLAPDGKVFVHGELWNAVADGGSLPRGTRVRVVRVDEMMLTVTPVETTGPDGVPPIGESVRT
ncbi:MAG TPA: nodulation protein NfeD [Candidatus Polarisedimenticolaceae bacterium]|nr:nodulation protein NfeD [Candidatus Polarisedimenticolaceae bacterium]